MTETQDVLAEAIGSVELGFWRETPIEDPDGVHGIEARFDVRAFAEAITANLTARGYALVRTPETLDVEPEPGERTDILGSRTFCGRCSHPMHWHECGADANLTAGPCRCRNDISEYHVVRASPAPDPGAGPEALAMVAEERARQDAKWGEQNHGDLVWLAVLSEEVGEASREILEVRARTGYVDPLPIGQADHLAAEVVQVAAVAVAWVEAIFRRVAPSAEPPETP